MNQTQEADNQEPLKTVQLQVGKKIQSEDNYLYYFESKRSGGGEVEKISIDQEKGIVYVTFVQPEGWCDFYLQEIFSVFRFLNIFEAKCAF